MTEPTIDTTSQRTPTDVPRRTVVRAHGRLFMLWWGPCECCAQEWLIRGGPGERDHGALWRDIRDADDFEVIRWGGPEGVAWPDTILKPAGTLQHMTDSVNADETAQADALARVVHRVQCLEASGIVWAESDPSDDDRDIARAVIAAGWCPVPSVDDEQGVGALAKAMCEEDPVHRSFWDYAMVACPAHMRQSKTALRHLTATPQQEEGMK